MILHSRAHLFRTKETSNFNGYSRDQPSEDADAKVRYASCLWTRGGSLMAASRRREGLSMQNSPISEPLTLTEDQVLPDGKSKSGSRSENARSGWTPTNPREVLWLCEDSIFGLHEEVIETYAHAYLLNAQIRSSGTFEAFLRARLLNGSHGANDLSSRAQANHKSRTRTVIGQRRNGRSVAHWLSPLNLRKLAYRTASPVLKHEPRMLFRHARRRCRLILRVIRYRQPSRLSQPIV